MADTVFFVVILMPHLLMWFAVWMLLGYLVWWFQFLDRDWNEWLDEFARRRLSKTSRRRMRELGMSAYWLRANEPKWFDESERNLRRITLKILLCLGPLAMALHVWVDAKASYRRVRALFRQS